VIGADEDRLLALLLLAHAGRAVAATVEQGADLPALSRVTITGWLPTKLFLKVLAPGNSLS
jgi:hypothetical protein